MDVTFNDITLTEIFEEGWVYDTLWVDEGCFVDGTGFPRCKIDGKNHRISEFAIKSEVKEVRVIMISLKIFHWGHDGQWGLDGASEEARL